MKPLLACLAFSALLVFGLMTLLRIVNRNQTTDGFKKDLACIRKIFRDDFDPDHVLRDYHPFKQRRRGRKSGGLADMVAIINSLLAAALAGTAAWTDSFSQIVAGAGLAAFLFALVAQYFFLLQEHIWLTHAGGVVYRRGENGLQYLLVGPKKDRPGEWLLPKGHIERHEKAQAAALREVAEETGVTAVPVCPLKTIIFGLGEQMIRCRFYLMKRTFEQEASELRRREWFSYEDAIECASHPETRNLLRRANLEVLRRERASSAEYQPRPRFAISERAAGFRSHVLCSLG